MNDRVVGLFEDGAAAEKARSDLFASGVETDRVTLKRVLQPGHRGFADSDTVHSLIHAPPIREGDTASEDAGTIILIVEMVEPPEVPAAESQDDLSGDEETPSSGLDTYDRTAVMQALERLGATDTRVVEATPPLDL